MKTINGVRKTIESMDSRNNVRRGKVKQAERAFVDLLSETSQRGFYGSASLTIHVQDGHIQHVRVTSEKLLK